MINRLSKRERYMAVIAALILILASYYFYLYQPIQEDIKTLVSKKEQKENQIATTIALERQIPDLKERYSELKEMELSGEGLVALNTGDFLRLLYKIIEETGVEMQSYLPGSGSNASNLQLILSGKYSDILSFLSRFKMLEPYVQYNFLRLKPLSDELLKLEIKLLYKDAGGDSS